MLCVVGIDQPRGTKAKGNVLRTLARFQDLEYVDLLPSNKW